MIVGLPSGGVAMRLRLAESGLNIGTLLSISIGLGLLQGYAASQGIVLPAEIWACERVFDAVALCGLAS